MGFTRHTRSKVALLLLWSAILLVSCRARGVAPEGQNFEKQITNMGTNIVVNVSENGVLQYTFTTPLMEEYGLAAEPYTEFREGVHIISYKAGSDTIEAELTANYAIQYKPRDLWEARGNVVGKNIKNELFETEQLFWDHKEHRIYSDILTTYTQVDSKSNVLGFEADEKFDNIKFKQIVGRIWVAPDEVLSSDTTRTQ